MSQTILEKRTELPVRLADDEALALAQFLKRAGFSQFRAMAVSDDEAYLMVYAASQVARALADVGFSPR